MFDFLPGSFTSPLLAPASVDIDRPISIPVGPMVRELRKSMAEDALNIFSPPNGDYWHLFEWNGQKYSANVYLEENSGEAIVDMFPFAFDATLIDVPLFEGIAVVRTIMIFPAGNA